MMSSEALMEKPGSGRCRCRYQSWYLVLVSFLLWLVLFYLYSSSNYVVKNRDSFLGSDRTELSDSSDSDSDSVHDVSRKETGETSAENVERVSKTEDPKNETESGLKSINFFVDGAEENGEKSLQVDTKKMLQDDQVQSGDGVSGKENEEEARKENEGSDERKEDEVPDSSDVVEKRNEEPSKQVGKQNGNEPADSSRVNGQREEDISEEPRRQDRIDPDDSNGENDQRADMVAEEPITQSGDVPSRAMEKRTDRLAEEPGSLGRNESDDSIGEAEERTERIGEGPRIEGRNESSDLSQVNEQSTQEVAKESRQSEDVFSVLSEFIDQATQAVDVERKISDKKEPFDSSQITEPTESVAPSPEEEPSRQGRKESVGASRETEESTQEVTNETRRSDRNESADSSQVIKLKEPVVSSQKAAEEPRRQGRKEPVDELRIIEKSSRDVTEKPKGLGRDEPVNSSRVIEQRAERPAEDSRMHAIDQKTQEVAKQRRRPGRTERADSPSIVDKRIEDSAKQSSRRGGNKPVDLSAVGNVTENPKGNRGRQKKDEPVDSSTLVRSRKDISRHKRRPKRIKPPVDSPPLRPRPTNPKDPCSGRYVYIHQIPRKFNQDLLDNCRTLSAWTDMCEFASNLGLGPHLPNDDKVYSRTGWFATNQFLLEVIFHNRMKQYRCLAKDPAIASAIYVPYYAGLDVGRYLWDTDGFMRDYDALNLVRWLASRPEWKRMWGKDHFMVAGRINWDFRRNPKNESDWGNELLNLPESRNMTTLVIESSPWNYNDFAIPYPTYFHPSNDFEIIQWQNRMRKQKRRYLFSFAGAPRPHLTESIRNEVIDQCRASRRRCKLLQCENKSNKCYKPVYLMKMFQNSIFCLQPPGDSYTRRSVFDSISAGCIPVFFHPGTAYVQYIWHLPKDYNAYSVFIPSSDVKAGKANIERILMQIPRQKRADMREEVIKLIPKVIYADPSSRLKATEDAFDLTVKGILDRVETIRKEIEEGNFFNGDFDEDDSWKYFTYGTVEPHEWDTIFANKNRTG